ncbi:MAG: hypothetical protein KDC87_07040 [Planctomycetes bacterium]|nr:hypothetical protein [Planctomycetota bacterium]MCB9869684.1 hypothetical protein [Planctomycetota bacterium]
MARNAPSALTRFSTDACAALAHELGDEFAPDPERGAFIGRPTEFGRVGMYLRTSKKGQPHSTHVSLSFGVEHERLTELRQRAGLPHGGFDAGCDSINAAALRGRPGRFGWRRVGAVVDTGPWFCKLDDDPRHLVERILPFVNKLVQPYWTHFAELRRVRDSILRRNGWCVGLGDVETAMLIDVALGNIDHLRGMRAKLIPADQTRFDRTWPALESLWSPPAD